MATAIGKESKTKNGRDKETMRRSIAYFAMLVVCATSGLAQSHSKRPPGPSQISAADRTLANSRWPGFIAAFRAAVKKRDRVALRGMITTPFLTQVDGELKSPDEVLKWLDEGNDWTELQREVAPGAKFSAVTTAGRRPQRCTNGIFCFEFGVDGRWRLSAQVENE